MIESEAVELIAQRMLDAWPAAISAIPFVLEGESLPSADAFAMLSVQHSPRSGQRTQGERPRIERMGWIWVKLWCPAHAGIKLRAQLADAARVVFERRTLGTGVGTDNKLTVQTGETQEGGTDGRWLISAVRFEFSYWVQAT